LTIQVSGTNVGGKGFVARAKTLLLSRHGAKIVVPQELGPEQEINITCPGILNGEAARVVNLYKREAEGFSYGIEFLNDVGDLWKTRFPPAEES
jgi:hypothetical protein